MGCYPYMAQVWLEATYDMTPMICMFSLGSGYGCFPWHNWLKMTIPCQYEIGLLETPILKLKEQGWLHDMIWGGLGA